MTSMSRPTSFCEPSLCGCMERNGAKASSPTKVSLVPARLSPDVAAEVPAAVVGACCVLPQPARASGVAMAPTPIRARKLRRVRPRAACVSAVCWDWFMCEAFLGSESSR